MCSQSSAVRIRDFSRQARGFAREARVIFAAVTAVFALLSMQLGASRLNAANSAADPAGTAIPPGPTTALATSLGVRFVSGSSSTLLIERDGKTYVVNLAEKTIQLKDSPSASPGGLPAAAAMHASTQSVPSGAKTFSDNCASCHGDGGKGVRAMKTPDFTNPSVQTALSGELVTKTIREGKPGTTMPAWAGKLSDDQINSVAAFVKSLGAGTRPARGTPGAEAGQMASVYTPADDYLFSMPTGRRLDRHGFYLNFTHRFAFNPTFTGTGNVNTLFGMDGFSISSFGLRFGVTDKLSVSAYRSPSLIGRPIELGAAYNFADEHDGQPFSAQVRASVDGQGDFSRNFTTNLEMILSRSVTRHAQLYFDPTVSLQDRRLIGKPGSLASEPPDMPGFNTFYIGVGGALDIRPSVALVAEVFPTLVNGPELGIHRPAFAFGIQKRVLRHAFTFGFSNSPGTVVSQRAGTRATFVGQPSADTPSGLFIGFDLMRQIY